MKSKQKSNKAKKLNKTKETLSHYKMLQLNIILKEKRYNIMNYTHIKLHLEKTSLYMYIYIYTCMYTCVKK